MNMWTIRLKVRPGGRVEVEDVSAGIPAGELEIRGTDDGNRAVLEARQRDQEGRFVVCAHHRRDRAEEAMHDLEAAAGEAIAVTNG